MGIEAAGSGGESLKKYLVTIYDGVSVHMFPVGTQGADRIVVPPGTYTAKLMEVDAIGGKVEWIVLDQEVEGKKVGCKHGPLIKIEGAEVSEIGV